MLINFQIHPEAQKQVVYAHVSIIYSILPRASCKSKMHMMHFIKISWIQRILTDICLIGAMCAFPKSLQKRISYAVFAIDTARIPTNELENC